MFDGMPCDESAAMTEEDGARVGISQGMPHSEKKKRILSEDEKARMRERYEERKRCPGSTELEKKRLHQAKCAALAGKTTNCEIKGRALQEKRALEPQPLNDEESRQFLSSHREEWKKDPQIFMRFQQYREFWETVSVYRTSEDKEATALSRSHALYSSHRGNS